MGTPVFIPQPRNQVRILIYRKWSITELSNSARRHADNNGNDADL